jgi:hypothetical protein
MVELRGDLDLALKSARTQRRADDGREVRIYDLERDWALMPFITGEVYGRHAAAPEFPLYGVPTG